MQALTLTIRTKPTTPLKASAPQNLSLIHIYVYAVGHAVGADLVQVGLVGLCVGVVVGVVEGNALLLTPVSYTHLDVYKRQPLLCAGGRGGLVRLRASCLIRGRRGGSLPHRGHPTVAGGAYLRLSLIHI